MRWRAWLITAAILLIAAAAWIAMGFRRAQPDMLTLIRERGGIVEVAPGSVYRNAGPGQILVTPRAGALRFPTSPDYRLFSADGMAVPIVFDIRWRVTGPDAGRRFLLGGSDSTFAEAVIEGALRRAARPAAAGVPMIRIAATRGEAIRTPFAALLRTEPGLEFEVTVADFDDGAATAMGAAPRPPLLVIGIDALDWNLVDELAGRGRLPHLAGLARRGVRADLHTLTPMLSPLIWTSMATGVGPDRHGILDFLVNDPVTGKPIPVTSSLRRAPAFWNVATAYGRPVDVVAWLATWPAETVNGRIVSDRFGFLAYAAGSTSGPAAPDMVSPGSLLEELTPLTRRPEEITLEVVRRCLDIDRAEYDAARGRGFERGNLVNNYILTLATAETSTRIGERFLTGSASGGVSGITAVYYEYLDAVGHLFMPFAAPRRPDVSADDHARYGKSVSAAHEVMDGMVGRLLAAASESTVVLVVSDHGFLSGEARPTGPAAIEGGQAARWHRDPGVLILAGPGIRHNARLARAHVLDVAPTILHLAGLPVSADLEGGLLTSAFDAGWLAANPVVKVPRYNLPADVWAPPDGAPPVAGPAVVTSDLDSVKSWVNLGLVLEQRGRMAEAEELFRRALAAAPDDPNARNNLANNLRRTGRSAEAIGIFESLVADHPEFRPALQNLGACFLEADQPERAITWFDRALALESGNVLARVNRGHARLRTGDADGAATDFQRAIDLEPRTANAFFGLGLLAGLRGDMEVARRHFERTLELDPDHQAARDNLLVLTRKQ